MKPEKRSELLLGVTRSKAKMYEYAVPEEDHIRIKRDPADLFTLSIGLLGELAADINRGQLQDNQLAELRTNLLFSARFFDAYLQSRLNERIDPYLILLGSASYYLCEFPGSSAVLAAKLGEECPDSDGGGLEDLLLWLLQSDYDEYFLDSEDRFGEHRHQISKIMSKFYDNGSGEEEIDSNCTAMRDATYTYGTPRQLLFGDVIAAVIRMKLSKSSWNALPAYSDLPRDAWTPVLKTASFMKELWPAQHMLGQAGIFRGISAVVQMPTSAGKTKATELIIRSAFLADRTLLAVIVAPFRSLCHEIRDSLAEAFHDDSLAIDELSDSLQADFEIAELLSQQQIVVVTPEKLLYVLRREPELASQVGLIIFDEGHQFDSGTRGITYELLLTSLRSMLPDEAQKVLISAVISNGEAIGEWLNDEPTVVDGKNLHPTFRSIGFASWMDQIGRIEFVDSLDPEKSEFFVPRVIESFNLGTQGKERNDRIFPDRTDGKSIALYLGLKLAANGSVAIFCGRKATVASVCDMAVDAIERNLPLPKPLNVSNREEVSRLQYLHAANLGEGASASKCAEHGIFSHQGNTPHGIRLAVEHAMREDYIRFVVCTSTLAQGVNLPIRYLVVTGVYQGLERIKVRDFHNLIGRAGRAGMHTEGSILFADPAIYDKRKTRTNRWRWKQVKELLEPGNSEPCISNLLSIFDPISSDDGKVTIILDPLDFVRAYLSDAEEVANLAALIAQQHAERGFTEDGVARQISWKISLLCAVESFLLSHWDDEPDNNSHVDAPSLAEGTLAFHLADEEKRELLVELFKILSENIAENVTEPEQRKAYGRTLYGVQDVAAIENWVSQNAPNLLSINDGAEALDLIWPMLSEQIRVGIFTKFDPPEVLQEIAQGWIEGTPFCDLLNLIDEREAKMIWGKKRRDFKIDHVVETCEGSFAYDGALAVGAVSELVDIMGQEETAAPLATLQLLQKRLKYGLPTDSAIALYELGFADRVVAQDLSDHIDVAASRRADLVTAMLEDLDTIRGVLEKYPSYYQSKLNELVGESTQVN